MKVQLCRTDELDDPSSKGFAIDTEDGELEVFVVKRDGLYTCYRNSCPHTGANLEWQEDQFLDMDKAYIQCATHDALFQIDDGLCIVGPCVGQSLSSIPVMIEDDHLYIIYR